MTHPAAYAELLPRLKTTAHECGLLEESSFSERLAYLNVFLSPLEETGSVQCFVYAIRELSFVESAEISEDIGEDDKT